ncbi:hypothetical protein AB0L82_36045 [Nocardia sp. NPDC052001]|uniref:hypothetical protein n=1 Tax=Nocardia sp. NPDC052001 TaxID=3154853 RepID=UPI00344715F3
MVSKSAGAAVSAAKLARERMAAVAAAHREQEQANLADVAAFLKAAGAVDKAAVRRDTAIATATQTYEQAVATAEGEQAAALRRIRERGASESELVALTGLEAGQLRALLRGGVNAPTKPASTAKKAPPTPQPAQNAQMPL